MSAKEPLTNVVSFQVIQEILFELSFEYYFVVIKFTGFIKFIPEFGITN
jgi:hypothetical protein